MEDNIRNEISQLNYLIEKHKQLQERSAFKSLYQSEDVTNKLSILGNINGYQNPKDLYIEKKDSYTTSKVYVNPNYKKKKNVIHVNPHVPVKSSIYINPKLIKNITCNQNQEHSSGIIRQNNQTLTHSNIQNKCSVHINPKLMTKLISKVPGKSNLIQYKNKISNQLNHNSMSDVSDVSINQTSNYIVPNFNEGSYIFSNTRSISKKKSLMCLDSNSDKKLSTAYTFQSQTKLVNNCNSFKKSLNTNLVILSQSKLVRIKKNPKLITTSSSTSKSLISSKKRLSCSRIKKLKSNKKNLANCINDSKINHKLMKNIDKYKTNWYNKIDKNIIKVTDHFLGLVSIGGIMYKTSRNQLIRSNCSVLSSKKKSHPILNRHSKYYITKNGKQLLKIDSSKKKINTSLLKLNMSISSTKNYKTNASNKVKQRSLQILRNKMHKNNQPCLLYQKFGYCANQLAGACLKKHDKKQVALCKNFLQGKCLLDNCRLSHNVGPEKMPTCKYFLEGCCIRDGCPYLHVKVPSKNPICVEFLRGYCSQGNECQKRHINACPEFDKSGKCSRGKFCQYPHKLHLTESRKFKINSRNKNKEAIAKQSDIISSKPETTECRKRYYDEMSEELKEKREKLLKHIKIVKDKYTMQSNASKKNFTTHTCIASRESVNCKQISETMSSKQRPFIGPLPAYIPIN